MYTMDAKKTSFTRPVEIDKESVEGLNFPREEVLKDPQAIKNRRMMLMNATSLGNIHRSKTKIIFEDNEGVKQVETTIWATSEQNISLKHGITIPIHRIHEVRVL